MRILLPIPRSGAGEDVLSLCASTASLHGAAVRLLFVVDRSGIDRQEAGAPPGAIHLAEAAARRLEEREEGAGEQRVEAALRELLALGVVAEGEVMEGDPHDVIVREGADCHLLVSTIGSRYAYRDRDRPGALVLRCMKERVLPVLLAGSAPVPVRTVVAACDGGEHSVRAVGSLAALGLWRGERILLAASHREEGEARRRTAAAREILEAAGYGRVEERFLPPPKGESVPALCRAEGAQAVLLGGWGEHRWDDLLGLSLTGSLLRDGRFHLFLHM